jgi:hypothetical protein
MPCTSLKLPCSSHLNETLLHQISFCVTLNSALTPHPHLTMAVTSSRSCVEVLFIVTQKKSGVAVCFNYS